MKMVLILQPTWTGGSSTTLYYNGKVVNKPADLLGERMIPTAFIVK